MSWLGLVWRLNPVPAKVYQVQEHTAAKVPQPPLAQATAHSLFKSPSPALDRENS